jgi:hypothetical protein
MTSEYHQKTGDIAMIRYTIQNKQFNMYKEIIKKKIWWKRQLSKQF